MSDKIVPYDVDKSSNDIIHDNLKIIRHRDYKPPIDAKVEHITKIDFDIEDSEPYYSYFK